MNTKYPRGKNAPPVAERIRQKISVDAVTGCWLWLGAKQKFGHGYMTINKKNITAHRASYLLRFGQIPRGLDLDHLCRRPSCVNPEHLEPVTRRENLLRGNTITASNQAKTHCVNGHEFTESNTLIRREGSRSCRTCSRIRSLKRYHERRLANG